MPNRLTALTDSKILDEKKEQISSHSMTISTNSQTNLGLEVGEMRSGVA